MSDQIINLGDVAARAKRAAEVQNAVAEGRMRDYTDIPWSERAEQYAEIMFSYAKLMESVKNAPKVDAGALAVISGCIESLAAATSACAAMAAIGDRAGLPKHSITESPSTPYMRITKAGYYNVAFGCGHAQDSSNLFLREGQMIYRCYSCGAAPAVDMITAEVDSAITEPVEPEPVSE